MSQEILKYSQLNQGNLDKINTMMAELYAAQGKTVIQTITNPVGGEFDFDNIPGGFKRLIIEGRIEGDTAAGETVHIFYNEDTALANYFYTRIWATNASNGSDEGAAPKIAEVAGTNAVSSSPVSIKLEGYAGSDVKCARGDSEIYLIGGSQMQFADNRVWHDSMTDPITRIRLRADNHATDQLLGTLTLYGEM